MNCGEKAASHGYASARVDHRDAPLADNNSEIGDVALIDCVRLGDGAVVSVDAWG